MSVKKQILFLYVNLYRALYYVMDKHSLKIILHRVFYVIFIPEGRARAAVGGQFASFDLIENSKSQKLILCRAFPKTLSLMRRDKILWKLRGYTTLPEQKVISSQIRSTNVNQLLLGTKI